MPRPDSKRLRGGTGRNPAPAASFARLGRGLGFRLLPVVALLPLACGADDRSSRYDALDETLESTYDVDPCTLLSTEDIESILAVAPGEPEFTEYEDADLCSWRPVDDFGVELVTVAVTDAIAGTYEEYLQNSEQLLGFHATPEQATKVEGPGDFAVWVPSAEGGMFQFFVAGHMIQVVVTAADAQAAFEASQALAGLIYARLP